MHWNKDFWSGFQVLHVDKTSWALDEVHTTMKTLLYKIVLVCTSFTSSSMSSLSFRKNPGEKFPDCIQSRQCNASSWLQMKNSNLSVKRIYGLNLSHFEMLTSKLYKKKGQRKVIICCPWVVCFTVMALLTVKYVAWDGCTALLGEVGWKYLNILHWQMEYVAIFKTGINVWI